MFISFIEIQNFRKLKSVHVDFQQDKTVFVGANNSGKTSAMVALRNFLIDPKSFSTNDFTLSNWANIHELGNKWETPIAKGAEPYVPKLQEWEAVLPSLDVWLNVSESELHHVKNIIPTLDWAGGLLGVRLRLEPKDLSEFYQDFLKLRNEAKSTLAAAKAKQKEKGNDIEYKVTLWPSSIKEYLDQELSKKFVVRCYTLDPKKFVQPIDGAATPQQLSPENDPLDSNALSGLIRIDEINAQRGFEDATSSRENSGDEEGNDRQDKRKLSVQLRTYYTKHIDPSDMPEPSDVDALEAISYAQTLFNDKLKTGFEGAFKQVESLGYPGVTDPKLTISTRLRPMDGLNHPSALQYEVLSPSKDTNNPSPQLPEQYNGLGYQNLISMVFRLLSFRDDWMQVGKVGKRAIANNNEEYFPPPLHLVLIEEPEAHLHVQVQQVFIRKAFEILRNHADLKDNKLLTTQLVVSTHSSHIAHECEFSSLRYFRRKPAKLNGEVPTSCVINMSDVFGKDEETPRFVARYLRAMHCDLFFADGAIFVEGSAERMLVPHFIQNNFEGLNQCYITLLEVGGSHAHRFRELIEHLGLTTLIITDIDAAVNTGHKKSAPVARNTNLVTRNTTLKTWLPKKEKIDELLDVKNEDKVFGSVGVAYQSPVKIKLADNDEAVEVLSNTFEAALVFENLSIFKSLEGEGLIKAFREAIATHKTAAALAQAMFDELKGGSKGEFALNLLFLKEPNALNVPTYIKTGLEWLQNQLKRKLNDIEQESSEKKAA